MHIKLPYAFQITGKIPGTRRMDRVVAADQLGVNVSEVSGLDAPVCLSWTRQAAYNFFDDHAVGPEGLVEIRAFDGNFYRPVTNVGSHLGGDDIGDRVLIDYGSHSDKWEELAAAQIASGTFPERYSRPEFQGETYSNEMEIVEALAAKANGLLIVDGKLFERCPEPTLVVEEDFERHNSIYISPAFPDKYRCGSREQYFTFAIDQSDEALAFARTRSPLPETPDITVCADVDVRAWEMVSRLHLANDVVRHAESCLAWGGNIMLNKASTGYVRKWLAFSDAFAEARLTPEDTQVELLLEAWVEFTEERYSVDGQASTEYQRGIARSLQVRFDERTMNPEAIFRGGPRL